MGLQQPTTESVTRELLRFSGSRFFRQRIILAVLSGREVRLNDIRPDDVDVGLRDYEVSFLRLIERITSGTEISISYTGTSVTIKPGQIIGGQFMHDCPLSRGIAYFVELLPLIAAFGKESLEITFKGITYGDNIDHSVDMLRTAIFPALVSRFQLSSDTELRILKRGARPNGIGEVVFNCPIVRRLSSINLSDAGRVRQIRGIAYSSRISPAIVNRLVSSARGVLNPYLPDIFIFTDARKGDEAGNSPSWGMTLVAESTTSCIAAAEITAEPGSVPEDLGVECAQQLLKRIAHGSCISPDALQLYILAMVAGSEGISHVLVSKSAISDGTIQLIRDIKTFFGHEFKISEHEDKVSLSCVGQNIQNISRKLA